MAKSQGKSSKKTAPRKSAPHVPEIPPVSPQKSTFQTALDYLNTYHPGWNAYLKAKYN